ncbi:uncharacterized protein LOC135472970 [Liolophura sinensis]|uniref:uncharacterized protein LOC135472970 n=1 Tax=Liolophura sinensis TaxID=3198878 RepID=UPI0031592E71
MKCEGCGKDAEVECADCAPKGADSEPLLLCQQCCSSVHIGQGRLSKHRVVSLAYKKQSHELKAKFEKYNIMSSELRKRKSQVNSCKEDIDERVKIYERQIRETTLAVCQKIKQRAITLIKKMKEAANKRASDIDGFEKYLNNTIFNQMGLIRKELNALDKTPPENYEEKVKAIEEQIEAMDFSHLREHLPSTCIEYSIDFAGVQQGIKALDFELLEPSPADPELENVTEAPKYLADSIEDGTRMKVCIQTAVTKSGEFWLQPDFPTDVYDKLIDISHKLRQDFICNLDWKTYEPEDEELQAGVLCCVLYPSDNKWYRGCVEELRSDRKSATVRYLDFGNTAMHSVSQILPYKCPVRGVPFQAVECRLSGLTEDLSHEAKWTFNDMVREKLLDCKFLKRESEGSGKVWLIELSLTQDDDAVINLNHMVRDRVVSKTQKEAISCRDVRLLEDNLPSSFKVISTTVKAGDSAPNTGSTGDEGANNDTPAADGNQGDTQSSEDGVEPPKESHGQCSQDIRKVVHKSQDIRNQPRSQDVRKSTSAGGKSQDVRKQAPSQDVRKSNPDNQDGRHSNSGNQEQMDDCSSFLSSIAVGGFSDDNQNRGSPAAVSLERIAEGWKHQQAGRKVRSRSKHSQLVVPETTRSIHPRMLTVTEVEASSEIVTGPMVVSSGGDERQGTWIPSSQQYRPPSGKPTSVLVSLKPPPGSSSLEREAQEVVNSVIQEIVSRFCVNGKMAGTETEVGSDTLPVPGFSVDLAYDMESRGSDEHSTETLIPSEDAKQQDVEADSEETAVKSFLLEEEQLHASVAEVKLHPYIKSNSSSMEDINVKDSMLKPEIQDKSLSNLCGYDLEQTVVKVVRTEYASLTEYEACDSIDPSQLLSMSTNEISQLDSIEPASDQWESREGKRDYSLRPEEDMDQPVASSSAHVEDQMPYSRLPRIMFVPGSTFMLYVVDSLHMNGTFCGQIARTAQEEKIFEQFTQELRNYALHCNTLAVVKEGALLLAPYENSWYRAEVIKVNPDQTVTVCFVDYGNSDTVTLRDLKPLPRHLVYVPHQTTTCSLVFFYETFTEEECEAFRKITYNQKLLATVVAHGYLHLQVTLAVTLDTGEMKDVATVIAEKVPRSAAQGTTNVLSDSDKRSRTTRSTEPKISILRQMPDRSMSAPPIVTGSAQTYPSLPYIDMSSKPVNCQYYPRDRIAPVMDYSSRRGATLEAFPPQNPHVSPLAHQYGYNGDMSYPPPRNPFPQSTDAVQPLRSPTPSHLREDATPFHPGSIYISPLKTEESLDMHMSQRDSACNHGNRHPGGDSNGAVSQSGDWQVDCQSVSSEPASLPAAPASLTSEPPSVMTSSAFDEDAWIEFETSKWPSSESVPSCKPTQHSAFSNSRRPQSNRSHSGRQRNARSRGSRDHKDVHRSGNSSDSSDRGERRSFTC